MIDCKDLLLKGRGDFYSLIKTESTWKTVSHYPVQTLDVRFYLFNSHLFQLIVVITTHKAIISANNAPVSN